MLHLFRSYAQILRSATVTPMGVATFAMVVLLYMGVFLWLSGLLVYNSQLNYTISRLRSTMI